jgi:arylsulfatase A-like enzyme
MNFWHYTVHTPIQAKKEHIAYFEEKAIRMGLDKIYPFEEGEFFPTIERGNKRVIRRKIQSDTVYAAMIKSLDESVGRLMETLKRTGKADNTIFIFTSDNGGESSTGGSPTCNLPLAEGKGWMYEGGVREPLIVHWPGVVEPGSTCSQYVSSPDFYPLMLEIADMPPMPEQHIDGMSFMPLLKGQNIDRGPIYWHYPHYGNQGGTPYSAVRWGEWKLIEFLEDGHLELYNVVNDISEKINLAEDYPDIAEKLRKSLATWRVDAEAKIPLPNPEWDK